MTIKRYESYSDTDVIWEDEEGWLVTYEDHCEAIEAQRATHLAVVEGLKAEIAAARRWDTAPEPNIDYPD